MPSAAPTQEHLSSAPFAAYCVGMLQAQALEAEGHDDVRVAGTPAIALPRLLTILECR